MPISAIDLTAFIAVCDEGQYTHDFDDGLRSCSCIPVILTAVRRAACQRQALLQHCLLVNQAAQPMPPRQFTPALCLRCSIYRLKSKPMHKIYKM